MKKIFFILLSLFALTQAKASNFFDVLNGIEPRKNFGDYITKIPEDFDKPHMNCSSYGEMLSKFNFVCFWSALFLSCFVGCIRGIWKNCFAKDKVEELKKKVEELEIRIKRLEATQSSLIRASVLR